MSRTRVPLSPPLVAMLISVLVAWTSLTAQTPPQNEGCSLDAWFRGAIEWERRCPAVVGETTYRLDNARPPERNYLTLVNGYDFPIRVDSVTGVSLIDPLAWGEICLNDAGFPGQLTVGRDEQFCRTKPAGVTAFPRVGPAAGYGVLVEPGQHLHVYAGALVAPQVYDMRFSVTVTIRPAVSAVRTIRQPKVDALIPCTGQRQVTPYSPWRNDSDRPWRLFGVSQFLVAPGDRTVDACVSVLTSGQQIRWMTCVGNTEGAWEFPPQVVYPGEYVYGWANVECPVGSAWDIAQYIYGDVPVGGSAPTER